MMNESTIDTPAVAAPTLPSVEPPAPATQTALAVPLSVDAYVFAPPEHLAGIAINEAQAAEFKAEVLEMGISPANYQRLMERHLQTIRPRTSDETAAELQKEWNEPRTFERNIAAAQTATASLPPSLQAELHAHGTNPAVVKLLAYFGREMREDRSPTDTQQRSNAYDPNSAEILAVVGDPKHPQHAAVTAQRSRYFANQVGGNR